MSQLGVRGLGVLSLALGAGALIGFAGGCFITNRSHCGYHAGGINNPCPSGFVCNVCEADNNGCVPESQAASIPTQCRDSVYATTTTSPIETETEADPTVSSETLPTSGPDTTTTTTVGTTATTEPVETTTDTTTEAPSTTMMADCDPDESLVDADCGEQYCVAPGQCGWCNSLPAGKSCADVDPLTPACNPSSGKCVECTPEESSLCTGNTPVCDPESNTCVPCTEHSQCATACDIQEGVCFPEDPQTIVYVEAGNSNCLAKDGKSEGTAFCSLYDVQLTQPKTTIRLKSGTPNISPGALAVPAGKAVAVVKHGDGVPEINGSQNGGLTFEVSGADGRLYISGIKLRLSQGSSIVRCAGAAFYAHDSFWEGNGTNNARAIEGTSGCKVFVHRSRIVRCGAGIQMTGGELRVENSFIMSNWGTNTHSAFNFVNNVNARITYSTIGHNLGSGGVSTFSCTGNGQQIVVRNSAVVGATTVTSAGCNGKISFEHGVVQEVADNDAAKLVLDQWFNPPQADVYTPKAGGPLADTAMWGEGDPRFDYTRQTKIPTDKPSYAGAKQPL
jgi:hypothetical protein